jgi:hypothetical protein
MIKNARNLCASFDRGLLWSKAVRAPSWSEAMKAPLSFKCSGKLGVTAIPSWPWRGVVDVTSSPPRPRIARRPGFAAAELLRS